MADLPIIDAHHHIWRQADLPWLMGPMQPRIFGPYEPLQRDYPIDEFLGDVAGHGVSKSIYVQTNWRGGKEVDETRWVQSVADQHGWPHAIVSYADLAGDNLGAILGAHSESPLFRGVRQQLHWHEKELYRFAATPDIMNGAAWRKGFAEVAERGLVFELQLFTSQFADGASLAKNFPNANIVLEHAGMLEHDSPAGRAAWAEGLKRLAENANVSTKFSGLGTFVQRCDPAGIASIIGEVVAIFGAERCLFGSNFPIEKLWTSYADLIGAHRAALAPFSKAEQRAILHDNAARIYRL
ncbi:MAG: amidohydrolase family protein [Rhodospirillaceae bacterium]|nr:amidohydrolase family protein [Rhodospirillaceae bacterium]MBT4426572.1 amidohydrolase family protein [Rhodospirillaceae bacterium]MBT5040442.1 amidohydrolase family protein [Rhodospirillaceae bacterium]MBT5780435.1 amidohydrolase family protein [Rhodospirillaceae bacterium]